jgi:hypothetical protein
MKYGLFVVAVAIWAACLLSNAEASESVIGPTGDSNDIESVFAPALPLARAFPVDIESWSKIGPMGDSKGSESVVAPARQVTPALQVAPEPARPNTPVKSSYTREQSGGTPRIMRAGDPPSDLKIVEELRQKIALAQIAAFQKSIADQKAAMMPEPPSGPIIIQDPTDGIIEQLRRINAQMEMDRWQRAMDQPWPSEYGFDGTNSRRR